MEKNTSKENIRIEMCPRCYLAFLKRMKNTYDTKLRMRKIRNEKNE